MSSPRRGAQLLGVQHAGIAVAIGIIAGGAQLLFLMMWFLLRTRPRPVESRAADSLRD